METDGAVWEQSPINHNQPPLTMCHSVDVASVPSCSNTNSNGYPSAGVDSYQAVPSVETFSLRRVQQQRSPTCDFVNEASTIVMMLYA